MANRNEYLQSLNRMRRNYQTGGNAMVNPSDDTTNVGEELSSFAYGNTNPAKPEEPTEKDKGNIFTRIVDTVGSTYTNFQKGLLGVIDDASDFLINIGAGIGKMFGADDEWAKQATQYNWVDKALEFEKLTGHAGLSLINGTAYSGEFGEAWSDFFNPSKDFGGGVLNESERRGSYTSDMGEAGSFIEGVEQGIGGMLPSLAIGELTGGLSLGAKIGIQAGVAGAESYGAGLEKAYSEGADYGKANAYGAVKGAIGAGTTAITYGVGAHVANKGASAVSKLSSNVGDKIGSLTNSKAMEVISAKVTQTAVKAGVQGAKAFALAMAEPAIKQLYNGKSFSESYNSENMKETVELAKQSALSAFTTSAVVSSFQEASSLREYGKDGYMAKYFEEKAINYAKSDAKAINKLRDYQEKETNRIEKRFEQGKITDEQRQKLLTDLKKSVKLENDRIRESIEKNTIKALAQGQEYIQRIQSKANKTESLSESDFKQGRMRLLSKYHPDKEGGSEEKFSMASEAVKKLDRVPKGDAIGRIDVIKNVKDESIRSELLRLYPVTDYGNNESIIRTYENISKEYSDFLKDYGVKWLTNYDGSMTASKGKTDINFGKNGKPALIAYSGKKLDFEEKGGEIRLKANEGDVGLVVKAMTDGSMSGLGVKEASIDPSYVLVPKCASETMDSTKDMTLAGNALTSAHANDLTKIIDKGNSDKSYVIESKDKGEYKAVIPTDDGKIGIITVDSKTNEIKGADIKESIFKRDAKMKIVPKDAPEKARTTKVVSKKTGNPIEMTQEIDALDQYGKNALIGTIKDESKFFTKGDSFLIYGKKPLYADNVGTDVTFDKVKDVFGMPDSLSKTYGLKLGKGADEALGYIAKFSNMSKGEVIQKLGYDAFIDESKGEVVTFDSSNLIAVGGKANGEEGRIDGDSQTLERDVSEGSLQKLQEYSSGNGREIEGTQDRLQYAKLIREGKHYDVVDDLHPDLKGVKVIKESFYTPMMRQAKSLADKLNSKVVFVLGNEENVTDSNTLAFHSKISSLSVIPVDNITNANVFKTTYHEFTHELFANWMFDENYQVTKELKSMESKYPEIHDLLEDHRKVYRGTGDDYLEEAICNILSGVYDFKDPALQEYKQELLNKATSLVEGGQEEATQKFYKQWAKDLDYAKNKIDKEPVDNAKQGEIQSKKESSDEFRQLQEESRKSLKDGSFRERVGQIDENVRGRLSRVLQEELERRGYRDRNGSRVLSLNDYKVFKNVDGDTFHDVFEIAKAHLVNGELVDLHEAGEYKEMKNYLSKDGMSGFSITKNGDLVSVFNASGKKGWLRAIEPIVKENAKTLDCYVSSKQNLMEMYGNVFGFKTASIMDWNPEYDHDAIGANHGEPKVAFMLMTSNDVVTKEFGKDDYDKALNYRNSLVRPSDRQKIISDLQAKSSNVLIEAGADVSKPVKYRIEAVKQGLTKIVESVLDGDKNVKLVPSETKQTFAELNLARPKDRHIAIDNAVKGLLSSKIEFEGGSAELKDLVTSDQIDDLKLLVNINLQGIAEPSKMAKWAESLHLSKLENKENIKSAKLLSSITKKIDSSMRNTFGYGDVATGELTLYKNIVSDVKPFFDNATISKLADNVLANYTDENLAKLYDAYGIEKNPLIPQTAQLIKEGIVKGKHLDPKIRQLGNSVLQLLKNDLDMVASGSHDEKIKIAKSNVNIAQGVFYGSKEPTKSKFIGKVQQAVLKVDSSIMSPSQFIHSIVPDSPLDKHFGEVAGKYENTEKEKTKELLDYLFKETNGGKDISKELGKKIDFKGEKITYSYALKVLNEQRTLGEDYYKVKGAVTNANGTRGEVKYTKDDIAELSKLLPKEIVDWNEKFVKEGLNGKVKEFTKERYKAITKTELPELEDGRDWYHISRVTDKALPQKGGSRGNTPDLSYLSKRVKSVADLNFDGDLVSDTVNYVTKLVKDLTWYEWVKETNIMLNQRIYGTTLNAMMQKQIVGWDDIVDLTYHQVLGIPYENTKSLFGRVFEGTVGNVAKASVLGIQTAVRTVSSMPWFASYFGAKNALAGAVLSVKHGGEANAIARNSKIIKQYSPYLKNRLESNEVISAETSQRMSSKISKVLGTPMRIADGYIVVSNFGFSCAQAKAIEEGYGDAYTDTNNKRAVEILEEAVKKSQPTNSVLNVGGFRYGQNGELVQKTFGMFSSQIQSFYSGVRNTVVDLATSNKKIKSMESSINHHKEREEFYASEEEKHIKERDEANEANDEEAFEKAQKEIEHDKWKQEEHKQARESQEEYLKGFKEKHAGKAQFNKLAGTVAGLLGSAFSYVVLDRLIKALEGKRSIKDWDGLVGETAEQAVFKSIPYISTIYYAIKNDSDLSVFTIDNLNSLIDSCKGVVDAINSGNGGHITGASVSALKEIAMYFGIPAKSVWKIFNGLWSNIDKKTNLSFNDWMGYLSSNKLKTNYNDALKKGDNETAKANLEVWTYNYSIKTSKDVIDEVYRLNKGGFTGLTPIGIARTYTDEKGEKHAYSGVQINAFKEAYAKADKEVLALIRSASYKSLDDEYKAKAVSSVYSYYSEFAKSKRDGVQVSSRIGKLLEATNGDIDLAKYIAGLREISDVTESRGKTRKENVIKAINKMSGFTKGERLLLAYLGGYTASDKNRTVLMSQLVKLGFDRKSALAYIS